MNNFYDLITEIAKESPKSNKMYPRIRFLSSLNLPDEKIDELIYIFREKLQSDTASNAEAFSYYNFEDELVK